jgi:hypothetical protein
LATWIFLSKSAAVYVFSHLVANIIFSSSEFFVAGVFLIGGEFSYC